MVTVKAHYGPEYRLHDPGNGVIGAALNEGLPYEHKVLYHIYRQKLTGRAIDVGAHIGNHSLWLALACGLQVEAFEPIEFSRTWQNVQLNCVEDLVNVHPCALGDRNSWATALGKGEIEEDSEGEIRITTLDEYKFDDVSLIKIDVEGWEPAVLRGAQETIERCRPVLYVEGRTAADRTKNKRVLEKFGYIYSGHTFGATPLEEWRPDEAR